MSYFKSGIFVTEEERQRVLTAQKCSGMFLSGGEPMGDPQVEVRYLATLYGFPPDETAFNAGNGEFHLLDTPNNRGLVAAKATGGADEK